MGSITDGVFRDRVVLDKDRVGGPVIPAKGDKAREYELCMSTQGD